MRRWSDRQAPDETNRFVCLDHRWRLQNLGTSHRIGQHNLISMLVEPPVLGPRFRQRSVRPTVSTDRPRIMEHARQWLCPTRAHRILEMNLALKPIVDSVLTIELNAAIVNELITAPGGMQIHGVVIVDHPVLPLRHAPGSRIEPNGNSFVGIIGRFPG